MKHVFTLAVALLLATTAFGQTPVITFDKTTHDFGKINEADGRVTTIFTFKNEGMSPLVLSNVRASCGCTTPKWTREPIEPGQTGEITVTYNPSGRPGRFQKTITITSNATEATTKLYIKGEVIPKPAQPAKSTNAYPIKMGELSLKSKSLNFGKLTQGNNRMLYIEYANQTDKPITVDVLLENEYSYIHPYVTLPIVAPNETGQLQFALQTDEAPIGPISPKVYVMVNNNKDLSDTYQIALSAHINEDFSHLSVEERQQAPIVEVSKEVELGTVIRGKKLMTKLTLTNVGINPLYVRRAVVSDPNIHCIVPRTPIKSGRKGDIKIELTTDANTAIAQYARVLTLITNDPNNPVINVQLNWVVK